MNYAERMNTVRGSVIRDVASEIASRNNKELIQLSGGLPQGSLFPIKELKDVTDLILSDEDKAIESLQYGLTKGDTELLGILSERLQKVEKMDIDMSNILITTGCQQGISLVSTALLDLHDTVIIEKPSYLDGLNATLPYECNIVGVDTDEEGIVIRSLERALDELHKVKLIYVIPNFQNPTGKAWTLDRRLEFLELLGQEKYDHIHILEDNPYGEIRFRGEFIPSLKSLDKNNKVIYLGSFSKIMCPGLRVGYVVGEKSFVDRLEEIKEGADLQSNQFAQSQIREYLKKYDIDRHVQEIRDVYKVKADVMISAIKQELGDVVNYVVPDGGIFMWMEVPEYINTSAMLSDALDANVSYIPGASFFADGSGTNTLRLNFSMSSEDQIKEGIKRLAGVIKSKIS
ncbi:MAG: PLP-dependent aminotransferase family protein [Eubacteriaceae bacterium]|jgi:2-aminoadipate transaminase|nr:PLP-dependent aminotransferase family protein [Eubacteriaceae bacterium]